MFNVAKWAYLIGVVGRIALLVLTIKLPKIVKVFFSYELIMLTLNECMVTKSDSHEANLLQLLMTIIGFIGFYLNIS